MSQPLGLIYPQFSHFVCKLNQVLYGLKHAPWAWYDRLSTCLLELGFLMSKSDTSLFIYHHQTVVIYFMVYVDDVIVIGSNVDDITRLIHTLKNDFPLKDLGPLHYFLGIECQCSFIALLLS